MLLMMLQLVTTFVIYKNIKSYEFMELISVDLDEVGQPGNHFKLPVILLFYYFDKWIW